MIHHVFFYILYVCVYLHMWYIFRGRTKQNWSMLNVSATGRLLWGVQRSTVLHPCAELNWPRAHKVPAAQRSTCHRCFAPQDAPLMVQFGWFHGVSLCLQPILRNKALIIIWNYMVCHVLPWFAWKPHGCLVLQPVQRSLKKSQVCHQDIHKSPSDFIRACAGDL